MKNITEFLGTKQESRVDKFERLSKGKSKEELRALETKMLKPEPLPAHTKKKAETRASAPLSSRSLKIVMPTQEDYDLLGKHFAISGYIEQSVSNVTLLCLFLRELESGRIQYDKKNKKLIYGTTTKRRRTKVTNRNRR